MVAELTTRPAVAPAPDSHAVPGLIDALTPPDMARKAVEMGISKITLDVRTSFLLSILAGAFIAIGAIFSLTVTAGASGGAAGAASLPYGVTRLLAGLAFSLGLVLVVVGGASCSPATSCCSSPGAAGASPRSPSCATGRWSTSATSWARSARRRS